MKAVPYLFIALAIAILTGSVLLLGGAYFELVHPTVVRKGQNEMAPANAYWFVGSILNFFASAILLGMIQLLREQRLISKEMPASATVKSERLETRVLVARPAHPLAVLLQPLLVLLAGYQIPFGILFVVYREQWSRNWFATSGTAGILLFVSFLLIRMVGYRRSVGDLHIELDDGPELNPNQLTGRIVLNRQSDSRSEPLFLQLKLYEIREGTTTNSSQSLIDTSEYIHSRELYWQIRFKTKSPIENPFQSETQFPFEVFIPVWLQRPWSRPSVNGTVGMEWQLEVTGRFASAKVSATLPIKEIPLGLKQPLEKRIKISPEELANFLAEQSILWGRTVEPRTMTIVRNRPSLVYSTMISALSVILSIACGLIMRNRYPEFVIWVFVGSIVFLFATFGNRYVYRNTVIHDGGVDHEMRFFGFVTRWSFKRDELLSVCVDAKKIQRDDNTPYVEFGIFLETGNPKCARIHLAAIRTRLLAKAFAKAIANELKLSVVYQVSDR